MANTRRTARDTQTPEDRPITSKADTYGNQPSPTTGTQGANIPTNTQGSEIPISVEGTNPLQMVILGSNPQETVHQQPISTSPLIMNAPRSLQLHTTDLPQYANQTLGMPSYGMPPRPMVGGSGTNPIYHEAYVPLYIQGLGPQNQQTRQTPFVQDYSGPYTEDEGYTTGEDVAPRRRRSSQTNRDQPQTTKEKIVAHEAETARLKKLLAEEEVAQSQGRTTEEIPIINLDPPARRTKRAEAPRGDPSILLPLGDPDDPTPPFTQDIMKMAISRKFKMPSIKAYDGTGDPANHVRTFFNALLLQPTNDAVKCRAFPQTLAGMAQRWYNRLPPNSIGSFKELSKAFINQFIIGRVHEKRSASLMAIQQGKNEALRDYINRFTREALKVPDLEDRVAIKPCNKELLMTTSKGR
ncbi:hypothetical protein POM88_025054 [Heracleum sosnowskyi]|uniref:Retrotransposon gag domain-containing protein n=1 Tax=Heracleum sosnowskyi TaxID=360622 RepID=A0AAD8I6B7_9APIA|nr:hypothetical protein POM88_025054 [Heracleum sosnowskyi]